MHITLPIPDDLAETLSVSGTDLARRALEAFAIEEFRAGRLFPAEVGRLLGLETRDAIDGFLKSHGEYEDYSVEDYRREQEVFKKVGL